METVVLLFLCIEHLLSNDAWRKPSVVTSPEQSDASSHDGVSHKRADGHHGNKLREIEEASHRGGHKPGKQSPPDGSLEAWVDASHKAEQEPVRCHGVEDAGQRVQRTKQTADIFYVHIFYV